MGEDSREAAGGEEPRMRTLVSGAAGFLGSHLVDRLLEQGHAVTGFDNYMTGREANLAHTRGRNRFAMHTHDVLQPFTGEYDRIYNLACPASPPFYQKDPVNTARVCFWGTDNLLTLARSCGARFFQASTSEVYGDPQVHPQPESYRGAVSTIGPRACYDEGKRVAETLCFDYARQYGLEVKVARIFNTYGPRMNPDDGRVVSNFIVQALRGEDITIYGDGLQTRSFCHVDDLIEGFLALMESPADLTGPINIGNPGEFTMIELANLVIELTGSKSKLIHLALPEDDPKQRRPDIARARDELGWEPHVPLREGLTRTIAYFEDELRRLGR
jgi:UDP-glucuronate decarboxylase